MKTTDSLNYLSLTDDPKTVPMSLDQEPSKKIKFLYYSLVTLGYGSLIAQLIGTKFVYSNCSLAFSSIAKFIFNKNLEPESFNHLSLALTCLDAIKSVTSVAPIRDTQKLLNLELYENKLRYRTSLYLSAHQEYESDLSYSYYFKETLILTIPILAMSISFVNVAMPSWISMHTWIGAYPQIDFPVGITLLVCHTTYFFLLSANDVLLGITELRNLKYSPLKILFRLSKLIFTAPIIKIFITTTYLSAKSAYTLDEFVKQIFNLEDPSIRNNLKIISVFSSCLKLICSRLLASFDYYLEPLKIEEDQYQTDLLSNESKLEAELALTICQRVQIRLVQFPAALVRSFCVSFIIYGLTHDFVQTKDISENYNHYISLTTSFLFGSITFLHAYLSELGHALNLNTRKFIDSKATSINTSSPSPAGCLAKIISSGCNFGNQATDSLITVAAMISLLGPYIGNKYAASLGLMIGIESGWVNFYYFKEKITSRVNQLVIDAGERVSGLFNHFSAFFGAHQKSNNPEDIDLGEKTFNFGKN